MATLVHPLTWIERRRARRDADHWIAHGFESRHPWRVAELTSERERNACARSLQNVLGEIQGTKLPGAVPLRRAALRPHLPLLAAIEARLLDGRPVTAAGMLGVNDLLTSPASCLFDEVADMGACLRGVLAKLDAQ